MKNVRLLSILLVTAFGFMAATSTSETQLVKCLIQMTNYTGEGAYIVVSLLDASGAYEETLYVRGEDPEWYSEIPEWWKFYGKYRPNIDAISGATISGGERAICVLQIPASKIDAGYRLRFETSVEDQEYYSDDLEFPLTTTNLKSKQEGHGFIRYVRMLPQ